ncbi:hypothetical protein D9M68_669010 [compost metagenome]
MKSGQVGRGRAGQPQLRGRIFVADQVCQVLAHVLQHEQALLLPPNLGDAAARLQQLVEPLRLVRKAVAQQHAGTREFTQEQLAAHAQEQGARIAHDIADAAADARTAPLDDAAHAIYRHIPHRRFTRRVHAVEPGSQAGRGVVMNGWLGQGGL